MGGILAFRCPFWFPFQIIIIFQKNNMLASSIFHLFHCIFYREKQNFELLFLTFLRNLNLLKGDWGVNYYMPPLAEIEFFFVFDQKFKIPNRAFTTKQYFNAAKTHLVWLFSVYQILMKNICFDKFVNFSHFSLVLIIFGFKFCSQLTIGIS